MSVPFEVAQRIFAASLPRTGVRASGLRRRIHQTPAMLPPKQFNVSGFSESLVLYYLNRVRATAGQDIGTFFGQIGNGILTPVFTRQRDAINSQLGLTVALGNNADTTSNFVFEYIMHMSAWLYSGFMLAGFFNDAGPATMTFESAAMRLEHFRNGGNLKTMFDTGTITVGAAGDQTRALGAKLNFVEYFAVGDVLRATLTMRSTTNATGSGDHSAVESWGAQDVGIQPHIFLHAQPTQETGNNALFARRV